MIFKFLFAPSNNYQQSAKMKRNSMKNRGAFNRDVSEMVAVTQQGYSRDPRTQGMVVGYQTKSTPPPIVEKKIEFKPTDFPTLGGGALPNPKPTPRKEKAAGETMVQRLARIKREQEDAQLVAAKKKAELEAMNVKPGMVVLSIDKKTGKSTVTAGPPVEVVDPDGCLDYAFHPMPSFPSRRRAIAPESDPQHFEAWVDYNHGALQSAWGQGSAEFMDFETFCEDAYRTSTDLDTHGRPHVDPRALNEYYHSYYGDDAEYDDGEYDEGDGEYDDGEYDEGDDCDGWGY